MTQVFSLQLSARQPFACQMLTTALERGFLAPAYLLTGRAIQDKKVLAQELACHLNCQAKDRTQVGSCAAKLAAAGDLSGACQNCRWILQEAHPQAWIVLSPEDSKSGVIAVEKARLLSQELAKTSAYKRLVIITPAGQQAFHRPAANALLKTIEEPGPDCVFILLAQNAQEVLPTIVSRCQDIPLLKPAAQDIWLPEPQYAEIGSLLALQNAEHPIVQDNYWAKFSGLAEVTATLASTLDWGQELETLSEGPEGPLLTIDRLLWHEYTRFQQMAAVNPLVTRYLCRLLSMAEVAKQQVEHYVKTKNAFESFALSCRLLCHKEFPEVFAGHVCP